jgi:DNA-binding transcriptional ArsR family regulator
MDDDATGEPSTTARLEKDDARDNANANARGNPDDSARSNAHDDDAVFKALADATRRHLLDPLFEKGGRTLTELESDLPLTRFGVAKHLGILEAAGLVVRRSGREKLHYLNPVPIRVIHDRWIDKYTVGHASALTDLRSRLKESE